MKVQFEKLLIPCADLGGTNPLPIFRAEDPDIHIAYDDSFTREEAETLGKNCGRRVLPYLMQDRYNRNRQKKDIPVVTIENEYLKAIILCTYGGRLYSLYDKENSRELLFRNPVIQPANLAIRDAWLSGGVEWNISQLGHTFTTCSPVFCSRVTGPKGEEFIRIYEYERQKKLFWQIDLHLPSNSRELYVYVRIINDNPYDTPMYWWSTTAVPEDAKTRVFANAERAMYHNPETEKQSMGKMPYFPEFGTKDYSYTLNLKRSNDFFLQTPPDVTAPWEAVAYGNGNVTFEKSTSLLHYRKVFCWGDRPGGWRWKEFLSEEGGGSYIEIQAGIGRSQSYGITMPKNSVWEFTTAFGGLKGNEEILHDSDWYKAREYLAGQISERVSVAKIYGLHRRFSSTASVEPSEVLYYGSGWGALEEITRHQIGDAMPAGMPFPPESLGEEQYYWLSLLDKGTLPEGDPISYMIDLEWQRLLEASPDSAEKYYHLGVMAAEVPDRKKARKYFSKSVSLNPNVWAYRALSSLAENDKDAETYYDNAMGLGFPDVAFAQEYMKLLVRIKSFEKAAGVFKSLPDAYRNDERVLISAVQATLAIGDRSLCDSGFFDRNFVNIQEGEVTLSELWYYYMALKESSVRGVKVNAAFLEWIKQTHPLPRNIDFRMK